MTKLKKILLARSLNARMMYISILGIALGLLVYFGVSLIGNSLISSRYMSDASISSRKSQIITELSSYVNLNGISGKETAVVARWTDEHPYVTVIIYGNENRNVHFSGGEVHLADPASDYDQSLYGRLYPVRFKDGIYQVAILDNSQIGKQQLVDIISLALACFAYIQVAMLYARKLTRRIIALSKEAAAVSSGDLDHSISINGGDELAVLAASMDEMRRSVIERMSNESRAWEANAELITAISHDIRTPMTSMLGYLGLLNESDFEDKERSRQFADSAYQKGMELKYLTDELFRYFLVFGKSELSMDIERLDGRTLWDQLIGEAAFDLQDFGFKVKRIDFEGEAQVDADPMYLMRVVSNLVSNAKKYADLERMVVVISELKDGMLSLGVSNYIPKQAQKTESTKIGLLTCRKIMEFMGGSFTINTDDEHFAAELSIPVK